MEELSFMIANTREELYRARENRFDSGFSSGDYLHREFMVELLASKLDNLEMTRDLDEKYLSNNFSVSLG